MTADWALAMPNEPAILGFMKDVENRLSQSSRQNSRAPAGVVASGSARGTGKRTAVTEQGVAPEMSDPTSALPPREDDAHLLALVAEIAHASESALGQFYDLTVGRVYGVALRIVRSHEMAEEVTSDVYLQVWRDAIRYDKSRGRVLGWLLVIARTRALDLLRRADEAFSHPEPHELVGEPFDNRDDPLGKMLDGQSNTALQSAIAALTPVQRQLVALAFFRGLSHSEIVEHTGIPLGSVKTHIRRALLVMRDLLADQLDSVELR